MTAAKLRVMLRWMHILLGLVIMCYIYSPLSGKVGFQLAMKFFIIPFIAFSGLWIWKFQAFNKFFKIR